MAEAYPEIGFIGIDITFKRVAITAQRVKEKGLKNVFCVLINARLLAHIFAQSEINGIIIFFPDPWIKIRQAKHRLFSQEFFRNIYKLLTPGGFFWLKTDRSEYFKLASSFLESDFNKLDNLLGFFAGDFSSTFEQCFLRQNLPIFSGIWALDENERAL